MEIGTLELNQRQAAYKAAVEVWKQSIQHEEDLASVEHSVADLDAWEKACFTEEDARKKTHAAKKFYEDGLRSEFFGFHGR
ncbi:hypothetical protein [Granulicella arctica]|uniref:hypothetical protein n=1 Tax=Granulicella arctica TaxID=940613 RepID=UPI0021DFC20B|nr:hypothetical protein [Granulicella arctica]